MLVGGMRKGPAAGGPQTLVSIGSSISKPFDQDTWERHRSTRRYFANVPPSSFPYPVLILGNVSTSPCAHCPRHLDNEPQDNHLGNLGCANFVCPGSAVVPPGSLVCCLVISTILAASVTVLLFARSLPSWLPA